MSLFVTEVLICCVYSTVMCVKEFVIDNLVTCCSLWVKIYDCLLVRKAALSGLTAGGMAQFIASPTDLVKVQMQMEGRRRLDGKPPR